MRRFLVASLAAAALAAAFSSPALAAPSAPTDEGVSSVSSMVNDSIFDDSGLAAVGDIYVVRWTRRVVPDAMIFVERPVGWSVERADAGSLLRAFAAAPTAVGRAGAS